ncbi:quinon protein alcohol dehydrogenase-like superfamily [Lyophyllum atratum]|nr:quinon protein alcohol dehydrogenase-like superfamily [Lyophyllum atratum]
MLSMHAIGNTSYDKQGKPPCDKETRVDILKEIMGWVEDVAPGSRNFLWLTGDPGCGKSAVTASIARDCKDRGILWAQFFINRNCVDTTDPNSYFPSIARQLAERSELVQREIHDRLKLKPSLMDAVSSEQATALFIDAIRVASKLDPAKPVVIVIDGLDETDRSHLRSTADIFSRLFDELSNHPNAKVYIASRTEDDIRNPFAHTMNDKCVKHLHLHTTSPSSIDDVSRFLRRKIVEIVLANDLDWRVWPGNERFDILATNASGLFIWAVTAVKFIQEQLDTLGTECLDDILDKLNSDGMGDINTLYDLILSFTYRKADEWAFESFRRMIGAIVVLHEPLSLNNISRLLDLRRSPSHAPVDAVRFVKRLRTVLVAGAGAINGQTVPRLHKLFFEFITSDTRVTSRFRVDSSGSHRELAFQCLRQLALAKSATATLRMPTLFRYAYRFSSQHFLHASGTASGIAMKGCTVDMDIMLSVLHQSSNDENVGPLFLTLSPEKSHIQASLGSGVRAWDVMTGIDSATFTSKVTLLEFIPSCSEVAFLPDGKRLVCASHDGYIRLYDSQLLCIAEEKKFPAGDSDLATVSDCFAFSPDRSHFVVGGKDGKLCLRDTCTGEAIGTPFFCHTHPVTCIAFSVLGDLLIAGYDDGILQIWNLENGPRLEKHFPGHVSRVSAVSFSPDGTYCLSCANDDRAYLWNLELGEVRHLTHPSQGVKTRVTAVEFSPDGSLAVSGDSTGTICFWDVQGGEQVGQLLEGHKGAICSLNFSPDGKQMVSGSHDKSLRIWDVETRQLIGPPLVGHSHGVLSVMFSPDGNQICSVSEDYSIRIWTPINSLVDGPKAKMTGFSPNGELTASISNDNRIRLWDAKVAGDEGLLLERHEGHLLDGQESELRCISLSSDGLRLAASSFDAVYLWDTHNGRLVAQSRVDYWSTIISLFFVAGSSRVVAALDTGTTVMWKEMSGAPSDDRIDSRPCSSGIAASFPSFNFNLQHNEGQYLDASGNMWISSNDPESGIWALIDDHIIRIRKDGHMTIVPGTRRRK